MDLRLTEKKIWLEIWSELYGSEDGHHLIDHLRNHFIDRRWLDTDAKGRRFEEAIHIIMTKIWKNVPVEVHAEVAKLEGRN